jgi:hypothetical protein
MNKIQVYPCPKGSLRHRDVVKKIGGKEQYVFVNYAFILITAAVMLQLNRMQRPGPKVSLNWCHSDTQVSTSC